MVLGPIANTLNNIARYLVSDAPYPIKMAFWIFLFLALSSIIGFFMGFAYVCDIDGTLYEPNGIWDAYDIQSAKWDLPANINYTVIENGVEVEQYSEIWWDRVRSFLYAASVLNPVTAPVALGASTGENVDIEINEDLTIRISKKQEADLEIINEYRRKIKQGARPRLIDEGQLITADCDREDVTIKLAGISLFNSQLWLVIGMLVIAFPLLLEALRKRD